MPAPARKATKRVAAVPARTWSGPAPQGSGGLLPQGAVRARTGAAMKTPGLRAQTQRGR